ncbi:MAG: polyprenyl synthetase family protein [Planctomycetota bacterium]|nr:polyprenyl synthetase family protein [Planctomycetota bacterium]
MPTRAPVDLDEIYVPIAEEMSLLGEFLRREFASGEPFIYTILQHISRFCGKQLRPALLFLTNRLGGGRITPELVKIGGVLEMIHTATLVHDDLLDDAQLRRNVETVHNRWGERAAVLIGDYIYSRAFQLSTEVPGMAQVLSQTTHTICEGELLQIAHRFRPELGEEIYLDIIRKKTAILHATACKIGGDFAALSADRCEGLYRFGMDLGIAFQIVDDWLDYAGDEAIVGKSLGTDLHQGKVTLPLIYLRESLSQPEEEWLRNVLLGPLEPEVERRVRSMVRARDSLAETFSRADGFVRRAKESLAALSRNGTVFEEGVREPLELVTDYVLKRRR